MLVTDKEQKEFKLLKILLFPVMDVAIDGEFAQGELRFCGNWDLGVLENK